MAITLVVAEYTNPKQSKDLIMLLNEYAKDPMGGGAELHDFTKKT